MGENSAIPFTDHTWNPWQGCFKIRPGCKHCYMYREKISYGKNPSVVVRSKTTFNDPLKWKDPAKVFTCSWSDFFIAEADPWRPEAWDIIKRTPHLTYLIITKRVENIPDRLPPDWGDGWPNVWLIATVELAEYLAILSDFLKIPAVLHGVSIEPMLGPMEISGFLGFVHEDECGIENTNQQYPRKIGLPFHDPWVKGIAWVICGGETDNISARPPHPDWIRSIRDQCATASIPFFFKSWGEWAPRENLPGGYRVKSLNDIGYFENDAFTTGNVKTGLQHMIKVGRHESGCLLDGREWREFPEVVTNGG